MQNKIKSIVTLMTLEEKCALCSGLNFWDTTPIARLGVPSIKMSDGPHGLRRERSETNFGNVFASSLPATCFPPAVTLAATWDRNAVRRVGVALGEECLDQKVATLLGPGLNIKRSPLCGRNFEYFSEDPYLSGELAAAYVKGVQSQGVGTSAKHFAVNSQEYRRLIASSEVDERALREIYLTAFEKVVKQAEPYTVMCSYNPVNGVHASDNRYLLNDILRKEWGYRGIVVSDWGAVNDRVKGIRAGLNLEMPSSNGARDAEIAEAVRSGALSESELNTVVTELLEYIFKCHATMEANKDYKADYDRHHQLAREVAAKGTVLLKNEDDVLPLRPGCNFAVIGQLAKKIRYQGTGSSKINPRRLVSFVDYLNANKIKYDYCRGYSVRTNNQTAGDLERAVELAKTTDYVVLFAGLTDAYESEAFDRTHIRLPEVHNALIEAVAAVNPNVIVVLSGGSPVAMPWIDKVKAVVNVYLGGEAGGEATYDVLFGAVNPSGKLPETYPLRWEDNPASRYYGKEIAEYRESIYVGYRYYDSAKKAVLFPFGHGLSYTRFAYSDLRVNLTRNDFDAMAEVVFTLTNTGDRDGAEVVQLYVKDPESTGFVPEKELRRFDRVELKSGESKEVRFELDRRCFAYYDVTEKDFRIEGGEFELLIGSSSRDIRLNATIRLEGDGVAPEDRCDELDAYYNIERTEEIPLEQFEKLMGRAINENVKPKKGEYDMNTVVGDLDGTLFCRFFRWMFVTFSTKVLPKDAPDEEKKMTRKGAEDMPIRNFFAMSGGTVPKEACEALLVAFNGRTILGLFRLIKAFTIKKPKKAGIYKK